MNIQNPISYTIKRIGKDTPEDVTADSLTTAGNPPSFHFSLNGREVEKIYVHALEKEPVPNYPLSAEEKAAWKKRVADSTVKRPRLRR